MFEQVLKTEIGLINIVLLKNKYKKDSNKSKNYIATYYHHIPEDRTLLTLKKQTFLQAWRKFFNITNAIKGGTNIEIIN